MSHSVNEAAETGPSQRGAEIGVGIAMAIIAIIGIIGSLRVGIGWAAEGPRAGFFPFYISLIVLISCAFNVASAAMQAKDGGVFATWSQLVKVMQPSGAEKLMKVSAIVFQPEANGEYTR